MSRTDKDKPYWVRTEWYIPSHNHCQFDSTWWGWSLFPDGPRECDLPESPIYCNPNKLRPSRAAQRSCTWTPEWPHRRRYWGPRPIDRRLCWHGPDRARVRAACHRAKGEYNSLGQTDVDVPTFQHRRAAMIGGGWWD